MFACRNRSACGAVERRERPPEEAFAGDACQQRLAERGESGQSQQQRVVGVVNLAKAETGIENDTLRRDTDRDGRAAPLREFMVDQRYALLRCEPREGLPVRWPAPGVHQDDAALETGAGAGHGLVP